MGKKTAALTLAVFFAAGFAYAVELEFSGEMKTGLFWENIYEEDLGEVFNRARMHNNDDAGPNEGRFRMDMHVAAGNVGARIRFEQTAWVGSPSIRWAWAFAYANLFDNQVRTTIGQLGDSPWSAGGPTIWQELDNQIGIRTEFTPNAVPGLNFGFVLNRWNSMVYFPEHETLRDILMETVFGIAYTNRYFHGRFSYRLDGHADVYNHQQEGMEMMYRLEARFIELLVPNLSVFANGWMRGIGAIEDQQEFRNFLYVDFTPPAFSTELRLGVDINGTRSHLFNAGIGFFYNILPGLSAGASVAYNQNFGEGRVLRNVPFRFLRFEPAIRFNYGNLYIALVYSYGMEYFNRGGGDPLLRTRQWLNLRTVVTF